MMVAWVGEWEVGGAHTRQLHTQRPTVCCEKLLDGPHVLLLMVRCAVLCCAALRFIVLSPQGWKAMWQAQQQHQQAQAAAG